MSSISWRSSLLIVAGTIVVAAGVLLLMGRVPVCECGVVRFWSGDISSNQNSQQFSDPYTFTHFLHGALLYGLLWWFFRDKPVSTRLVWAVVFESGWEVLENTDFIIDRYREATVSLDYFGDSVLNSVTDILAMIAGFLLAWRLPVRVTVLGAVALDIALLFLIRDSLALNIIMLIHPIEAIRQWQIQ